MSRTLSLAAAALLTLALAGCGDDTATVPATEPSAAPSVAAGVQPPAGFQFVGVGHAVIAVPTAWGRNKIHCGYTPEEDTYIVDISGVAACASQRGKNLENVIIPAGKPRFDFTADKSLTIDGVAAQRRTTTCTTLEWPGVGDAKGSSVEVCSGSVYVPSERAEFIAESSSSAAEVDAMLDRVRVLPDQLAVPGTSSTVNSEQERQGEAYVSALEAAGFRTAVRHELRRGLPDGFVLTVDPEPGSVATPGDLVTVTTSGGGAGPADELTVELNSSSEKGNYDTPTLTDEQIRDGATVTFHVGDRLWAYGSGKYLETLAGNAEGSALTRSTWDEDPNKGRSWVAAKPGTSKVTLFITVDGEKVELGTFTVVVKPAR